MVLDNFLWFYLTIIATLLFGIGASLYKIPATRNISRYTMTFWSVLIPLVLSLIFFWSYIPGTNLRIILYGGLWGVSFALLVMLQMYMLKHIEINSLLPATSSLSLLVIVLFGLVFFKDSISMLQILGIVFVMAAVYFFIYHKGKLQHTKQILYLALVIIVVSAFNKIIQKIAVDDSDIYLFQIFQFLFACITSIIVIYFFKRDEADGESFKKSFFAGSAMGAMTFFGGWLFLKSLTMGPFSVISAIQTTYVFIASIIGVIFFREQLTLRKILLIILAMIAVALLRLG